MNDLMTQSFLSYIELKKQAMKDLEAETDLEAGGLTQAEEENLSYFFKEVDVIRSETESISCLLADLQILNEEARSTHSAKSLRGLRDRMDSNMVSVLRKAKIIKARLEALDRLNFSNRAISVSFREGSSVDRTRFSVTNGLRCKLKELMNDFQALRERMEAEHKETLKRKYFNETGEEATEEVLQKMASLEGRGEVMGKMLMGEAELETLEREKTVNDIRRSLKELHQVFLDMAVLVEAQGERVDNIEENVARAATYISGGTDRLTSAKALRRKNRRWLYWIVALVVILVLVCLIPVFASS
ncbi:Syntaxin-112 [Acorus gramineus]|uniref:Syntaxin-112 n=1 Tax=Acorus gramineus TaxID=55184 RepID=A0AAV9BYE1_ACOGR|nr:Syntaxin-112 [Acorus gramineus]